MTAAPARSFNRIAIAIVIAAVVIAAAIFAASSTSCLLYTSSRHCIIRYCSERSGNNRLCFLDIIAIKQRTTLGERPASGEH